MADALRHGGILAFDVCDLAYGALRRDDGSRGWARDDWALVTQFSLPTPIASCARWRSSAGTGRLVAARRRTP